MHILEKSPQMMNYAEIDTDAFILILLNGNLNLCANVRPDSDVFRECMWLNEPSLSNLCG